tara:strand:- start:10208 stop:10864 length:657 start_codon:yes stop_codon:yes gene_type:complete
MSYIITSEFELNKVAAPNLPLATPEYDRQYFDQLLNVLRLYFNRLDALTGQLMTSSGGAGIRLPYGAFSSYTTQATTANTATLLTLSNTDFTNGVTLATGSKMTVANAGIYNLQFSVQVENLDNAPQDMYIWLKQNGTDIVGSTGVIGFLARKNPGDPSHDIKGWNYFLSMAANDYVQIYWSPTIATLTIPTYAASGTPTKPSTASVVATLSFVSALP